MELQFHKKDIPFLQTVLRQEQSQEQTQEVRLPEGFPDIGRVVTAWGQVVIRGKEWRSGGMSVSGGVMAWMLYTPEDGSTVRCVEAWLPFQMKWDFSEPEQDGVIAVYPLLTDIDARSTSARKIMVRSNVCILAEAMCDSHAMIYEPDALPDDIRVLKNTYPICFPVEAGEKAFQLEEPLQIPETKPAPVSVIRCSLQAEVTEQRLLTDKLIFRGSAQVTIVYIDGEGEVHRFSEEVPFSQYAELDRDYSDDAKARVHVLLTNLEIEKREGQLLIKAGLSGQYLVQECKSIVVVEDGYSPTRSVKLQIAELELPAVLDMRPERVVAEIAPEDTGGHMLDAVFYPEHAKVYREADQVIIELAGCFQFLCMDEAGHLHSQQHRWENSIQMAAGSTVKAEALLKSSDCVAMDATGATCELQLVLSMIGNAGVTMLTGIEMGEQLEPDPERPSLILCRAGDRRLWDIAKQTGSTVEAIQKANGLQQEPDEDRVLLIPVP